MNGHGPGFGAGNSAMPAPLQDQGTDTTTGQQAGQNQPQATTNRFAEFLNWLIGHNGS
ncbi:MAG: hypothetical protein WCF90_02050 [Methanomicrobiales archaeon]